MGVGGEHGEGLGKELSPIDGFPTSLRSGLGAQADGVNGDRLCGPSEGEDPHPAGTVTEARRTVSSGQGRRSSKGPERKLQEHEEGGWNMS